MFDWFFDYLKEAIQYQLNFIIDNVTGINTDGSIYATIQGAMSDVYAFVVLIQKDVTAPVGVSLLGIFLMIELIGKVTKDQDGQTGVGTMQMVMVTGIKLIGFKLILDIAPMIMIVIYDFTRSISQGIANLANTAAPEITAATVENLPNDGGLFFVILIMGIAVIVSLCLPIIVSALITLRFVEIYIYMAFSPIPLATLVSEEMRNIGIGFLKSFAATCMQGAVLVLVLMLFPLALSGLLPQGSPNGIDGTVSLCVSILGYCVVMIIMLLMTNKMASRITGA